MKNIVAEIKQTFSTGDNSRQLFVSGTVMTLKENHNAIDMPHHDVLVVAYRGWTIQPGGLRPLSRTISPAYVAEIDGIMQFGEIRNQLFVPFSKLSHFGNWLLQEVMSVYEQAPDRNVQEITPPDINGFF